MTTAHVRTTQWAALSAGALPGGSYPMEGVTYLEDHLRWMVRCGRKDRTVFARRREMVLLAESIGKDPLDATTDDLERWQDRLAADKGLNAMRLSTTLIRPYYAYLHARGYRHDDPAKLLPIPPVPHRLPRPMTEDKVTTMVEGPAKTRVHCWLLIAGWMGLRAAEIAGMHRDNIWLDEAGQRWLTVIGKGNRQRNVAMPDWLYEYLDERMAPEGLCWRRERHPERGPVMPNHVSELCNVYLHGIGIPDTLHSLRHRLATSVLENSGGDLRLVQTLLGHVEIKTTTVYTQVAPRRVAEAVRRMPPPAYLSRHLRVVEDSHTSPSMGAAL